jgi:hypothetical protein
MITPHDLGDFVGCYGSPVSTPNLDAPAADEVLFQNHLSSEGCAHRKDGQ